MIGIKYLRYHPEFIFQLPSGLTIYKSYFENADGYKENSFDNDEIENQTSNQAFISKSQIIFNQVEETGTLINYRCVKCRTCKSCKDHDQLEAISIKEEVEQDVINRSVKVGSVNRTTVATLPFMHDPMIKLQPN